MKRITFLSLVIIVSSCSTLTKIDIEGRLSGCPDTDSLGIQLQGGAINDFKTNYIKPDSFSVSFNLINAQMPEWLNIVSNSKVISSYAIKVKVIARNVEYSFKDKNGTIISNKIILNSPSTRISNLELKCN